MTHNPVTQAAELESTLTADERTMLEPQLRWVACPHCDGAATGYTGGTFCPVCQRSGRMLQATANIIRTALIFSDIDCSERVALQKEVARLSAELATARTGEAVAWMYERPWDDHMPAREARVERWSTGIGRYAGWVESPLYTHLPTPPAISSMEAPSHG